MRYAYPELIYRGNYAVTVGVDYSKSFLRADFGGGLSETETVFPGLLYAKLNYSALHSRAMVQPEDGEPTDRLTYFYSFYRESMDNGIRPFVMRVPRPLTEKPYLWEFTDLNLEFSLVDQFLATTGISIRQAFVRGMNFLNDGSIGDETDNPATV
jgi:hypothetical protein